jgi:hypothetical protein
MSSSTRKKTATADELHPIEFTPGSQTSPDFKQWQLKDWYKRILSLFTVDEDKALDIGLGYLTHEDKGLIAYTAAVFAPITASQGSSDWQKQKQDHDALLGKLRATGEGALFMGARAFVNDVYRRYEHIKSLFKILRQGHPGYDPKQEAHLYLAWRALACVAGDVKALADMGSFFCAHYYVVENFREKNADFSSCGEAFELALATRPDTSVWQRNKTSMARERARYCFHHAMAQAEKSAEDYNAEEESDAYLYGRIADVAYIVDSVAQFNEFYKDYHSNNAGLTRRKYENAQFSWVFNGELAHADGSVSYLLDDKNDFLGVTTQGALERLLSDWRDGFPDDICFLKIIDDYYDYLTQDFLTEVPSTLVMRTAILVQHLMVEMDKAQDPESKKSIAADDLLPEYTRRLQEAAARDSVVERKLIYIAKAYHLDSSRLHYPATVGFISDTGLVNYNFSSFFSAMIYVARKCVAGQDDASLKNLIQELATCSVAGSISDDQLFVLIALNDHYALSYTPSIVAVMSDIDSIQIKSVAEKFPAAREGAASGATASHEFFVDESWGAKKLVWEYCKGGTLDLTGIVNKDLNYFKYQSEAAWDVFSAALDTVCLEKGLEVTRWQKPPTPPPSVTDRKHSSRSDSTASSVSLKPSGSLGSMGGRPGSKEYFNDSASASVRENSKSGPSIFTFGKS